MNRLAENDIVFSALPHGVGLDYVKELYEMGVKIIDLSGDYRLKKPEDYEKWYGYTHPYPELLKEFTYGLPEVYGNEIRKSRAVASPGCNSTISILGLFPLIKNDLTMPSIIIDVKVGSSEGGKTPRTGSHHPEREGAIRTYSPEGHRHIAEIKQVIEEVSSHNRNPVIIMIPHSVGAVRGAYATITAQLKEGVSTDDITRSFYQAYRKARFVRIVRGGPKKYPDVKDTIGSNFADIGWVVHHNKDFITVFVASDNLVRGAAGQAIHSMNLMLGFRGEEGLLHPPIHPV